jgi:hypothetical protein
MEVPHGPFTVGCNIRARSGKTLSLELLTMTDAGVVSAFCGSDECTTLNDRYQCSSLAAR